jgi:hypothetical protein
MPEVVFFEAGDPDTDSVSHFWASLYAFFSIFVLPFCRGEKTVQHISKSFWGIMKWLNSSQYTVKN